MNTIPSRRDFLSAAALAAGVAMLPARAKAVSDKYPAGLFFDVHTHLGQTWNNTKELTPDKLLKWMDDREISQAAVLPLVSPESSSFPLSVRFVLEQTERHRDRLIPFCCIDPRTTINGPKTGVEDMFKTYVDAGCRGFGEHKPGLPIDDPLSMRLYRMAGRFSLPVLFHLDNSIRKSLSIPDAAK